MARKNLKVPESLFLAMDDDKDNQQSWPHYLEEQCLHGPTDAEAIADAVAERVETVQLEASERRKIADEVTEQLR